jgi:ABC-type multidrug transport system fused ATPase/permease subunit
MERDPLRLAWTTARAGHLAAGLLLAGAGALFLIGLDCLRGAVDGLLMAHQPVPLLRFGIELPDFLGGAPLLVTPGVVLDPSAAAFAALAGLIAVPVLTALLLTGVEWIAAGIAARVLSRVRRTILDAIVSAPPAARDEAAHAASHAGEALSRDGAIFGSALLMPIRAGGTIALALVFAALADGRMALALAAMLVVAAALGAVRLDGRYRTAQVRRAAGTSIDRSLAELLRRVPALRAHGTGGFERDRLSRTFAHDHRSVQGEERRLALAAALAGTALLLTPLVVIAVGAWFGPAPTPGSVLAAAAGAALAASSITDVAQWRRRLEQARPVLGEASRSVSVLRNRYRRDGAATLPGTGAFVAKGVSAYDPASGGRITGVDVSVAFPAHVALVGDGDAGPRLFASLIGGQLEPSTGRLTFGGVDLAKADPSERARRIAFAGGGTILMPGTLRENLVYGSLSSEPDLDDRLAEAVSTAGLDRLIHARGLAGTLDPIREPKLAAAIVEARRSVRAALASDGLDRFVDPFDVGRYNDHATIGENLLFGKPIGDTFGEANLAAHPFVRAVLEADELTKPLAAVGLSVATSMIEIFAEIPDGHPLFERFSFFSAADRPFFEDLVERRTERKRGPDTARDRERLIGLALRYSESRHRLGLIDDRLRERLLAARGDFAKMLPSSLQPAIEFYDEARLCTAASVQDNLLFGRLASDQAGAEAAVHAVTRRVLTERGLDAEVSRIGFETPVDPRGADLTLSEIAAIDLVRCLVRRPDVLVVERALDGLPGPAADALVARLRRALVGRGLVLATSAISQAMESVPFDAVIRFERGVPRLEDRRARRPEPVPA